jgi:hypothetical protein
LKKAPAEDDDTKEETVKTEDVEMADAASEVDIESKPG